MWSLNYCFFLGGFKWYGGVGFFYCKRIIYVRVRVKDVYCNINGYFFFLLCIFNIDDIIFKRVKICFYWLGIEGKEGIKSFIFLCMKYGSIYV